MKTSDAIAIILRSECGFDETFKISCWKQSYVTIRHYLPVDITEGMMNAVESAGLKIVFIVVEEDDNLLQIGIADKDYYPND